MSTSREVIDCNFKYLGCQKLGITNSQGIKLYSEDGLEIDSDEVLQTDLVRSSFLVLSVSDEFVLKGKQILKYVYYCNITCQDMMSRLLHIVSYAQVCNISH